MFQIKDQYAKKMKYIARSKGVVVDNRDPYQRGRIRVSHPLLGDTVWINYVKTPGGFDVPPIGSVVYVECETGDHAYPFAHGNIVSGPYDDPNIPDVFQRDIPTNRGLYTPGGHTIELDDGLATLTSAPIDNQYTTDSRGIRVTTIAGNKIWISEDIQNDNQGILIQDIGGNVVRLDYTGPIPFISIQTTGNMDISIGKNWGETVSGNKTVNITGSMLTTAQQNIGITADKNVLVEGQVELELQSPLIIFNNQQSGITTSNSHLGVIDLITCVPVTPSTTTFGDV